MIRRIKLGSAVAVAAIVVSAFGAAAAWSANFTAESPTGVSGSTNDHSLLVQGSEVFCGDVEYTSSIGSTTNSIAVTPVYENCKAFGFLNATVSPNGCTYRLSVSSGSGDIYGGTAKIECPPNKTITIVAATCTVHIPAQTPTTPNVSYTVETGTGDILVIPSTTGIHSNVTSGFLCPLTTTETDASGKTVTFFTLEGHGGVKIDIG